MILDNYTENLLKFVLKCGDDRLILSHRLAELCGHAPILEEDIALSNISLDLLGQTTLFYKYASELEGKGNTEDFFAYRRNERQFLNLLLVEQANDDFAYTIARQFLFDAYEIFFYEELIKSNDEQLSAIAQKSIKETKYHLRHSSQWILRLGDGTDISKSKIQTALDYLWMYSGEMFEIDENEQILIDNNIIPNNFIIYDKWIQLISKIFDEAKLNRPDTKSFMQSGGRKGIHTENLGHILAEMQYLTRSFPDAKW